MTAHERSGWRDHGALPPPISTWHRDWGHNVPMVDIDFLAIDYDREKPVAIIDYKEHSKPLAKVIADLRDCSNDRTLRNVADRLGVAYMVVRYWDRVRAFQVFPRNERAKTIYKEATVLTERSFVASLYFLRDREAPQDILDGRRDELPACRPCGAQPDDPQNPLSVHVDGYLICNDCLFKPAVAS